jgi:hypothetical protein
VTPPLGSGISTVRDFMEPFASYVNHRVVLDLRSPYVCLGRLTKTDATYFYLEDADLHDLRDSPTTRENYTVAAKYSGIKPNRKHVLIRVDEVIGIALYKDIIDADDPGEEE